MRKYHSTELKPLEAVHCLVHPGFDAEEHPDFEHNLHVYIDYIARRANDVLLIVSDGECFDEEQLQKFQMLDAIEGIVLYLGFVQVLIREKLSCNGYWKKYGGMFQAEGFDEHFFNWCFENIDMTDAIKIEEEWNALHTKYFAGEFREDERRHDLLAEQLNAKSSEFRRNFDIAGLAEKATRDLGIFPRRRGNTKRKVANKERFIRIYQHAMRSLGPERLGELFIADSEHAEFVNIQPVTNYRNMNGIDVPTNHIHTPSRFIPVGTAFNQSQPEEYGNAAIERDQITYELSVSRNRKLEARQVDTVLRDMGFRLTLDTQFYFFGEYRGRCVNNVAEVVKVRLDGIGGGDFFIAEDELTLQRADDKVSSTHDL